MFETVSDQSSTGTSSFAAQAWDKSCLKATGTEPTKQDECSSKVLPDLQIVDGVQNGDASIITADTAFSSKFFGSFDIDMRSAQQVFQDDLAERMTGMSTIDLRIFIGERQSHGENNEAVKAAYRELIERADRLGIDDEIADATDPTTFEMETNLQLMNLLVNALEQGKDIDWNGNSAALDGNKPLTEEGRWDLHNAVMEQTISLSEQVTLRTNFAHFLKAWNQFEDADVVAAELGAKADQMHQKFDINGEQVSFIDLMKRLGDITARDSQNGAITAPDRKYMLELFSRILVGGDDVPNPKILMPFEAYKTMAAIAMRAEASVVTGEGGQKRLDVKYGEHAGFSPNAAFEALEKARQFSINNLNLDPSDPAQTWEGAGSFLGSEIPETDDWNLLIDRTSNGKPDLIEKYDIEEAKAAMGIITEPTMLDAIGLAYPPAARYGKSLRPAENKDLGPQRIDPWPR